MLTDAQVERYSRQILLPEVGGRGQARLLAARVAVGGDGPAAAVAVLLLGRAGVGTLVVSERLDPLPETSPDSRLVVGGAASEAVDLDVAVSEPGGGIPFALEPAARPLVLGIQQDGPLAVATLVGRPCRRCWLQALRPEELQTGRPGSGSAATIALGALVASEALRVLLAPPAHGRLTRVEDGAAAARDLISAGCSCCAAGS